jgi:hypothetical protein
MCLTSTRYLLGVMQSILSNNVSHQYKIWYFHSSLTSSSEVAVLYHVTGSKQLLTVNNQFCVYPLIYIKISCKRHSAHLSCHFTCTVPFKHMHKGLTTRTELGIFTENYDYFLQSSRNATCMKWSIFDQNIITRCRSCAELCVLLLVHGCLSC